MAFTMILLQELITGKGVIKSVQDGDITGYLGVGIFLVVTGGLTAFLASKGDGSGIEIEDSDVFKMPKTEAEVKKLLDVDDVDMDEMNEFISQIKARQKTD